MISIDSIRLYRGRESGRVVELGKGYTKKSAIDTVFYFYKTSKNMEMC